MKKSKDVKFIIYQALYIFVVCVIAIKGADLTLTQVIEDDGKPKVILTPEQMDSIQELLKKAIIVDTNRFALVDKELLKNDSKTQELVKQTLLISGGSFVSNEPVKKQDIPEKVDPLEPVSSIDKKPEIVIGSVNLYKYHENIVPNQGNNPINVSGVTIPAHSTGRVTLGGESVVTITAGDISKTVNVLENRKPTISFQRVTTMGEDVRASTLQRMVGFRVTITDDFPSQLDVKFNGAVTVKNVATGVYDVTMNAFSSRVAFDMYTDSRNEPYSVGFTVTVTDKLAPHKITGQNQFLFSEW
jgi:hypothetical protein